MLIESLVHVPDDERWGGIDRHHIVFRSQGGFDCGLNLIEMPHAFHIGPHGPHQSQECREILLRYVQERLAEHFHEGCYYSIEYISRAIQPENKACIKILERRLFQYGTLGLNYEIHGNEVIYEGELITRVLMGGKLY